MTPTKFSLSFPKDHVQPGFFCYMDVLFDNHFLLTGYRIIIRKDGQYDVRVPERPINTECIQCGAIIPNMAKFCQDCGYRQPDAPVYDYIAKRPKWSCSVCYSKDGVWTERFNECVIAACELTRQSVLPQQDFDLLNFNIDNETPHLQRSGVSAKNTVVKK